MLRDKAWEGRAGTGAACGQRVALGPARGHLADSEESHTAGGQLGPFPTRPDVREGGLQAGLLNHGLVPWGAGRRHAEAPSGNRGLPEGTFQGCFGGGLVETHVGPIPHSHPPLAKRTSGAPGPILAPAPRGRQ